MIIAMPSLEIPTAGIYLDDKGYFRHSAGPKRSKRVHRDLMEQHLGRPLRRDEHVHHRDENKTNNQEHADGMWNLELLDESTHNAITARQYWYLKKNGLLEVAQ
jgi:hypothetical protein